MFVAMQGHLRQSIYSRAKAPNTTVKWYTDQIIDILTILQNAV